ncbi:MAG: VOC family protein [Candidatus Dormibacteraeota bacterium]|nr:VOC family protein [Candidatus Dormibacteraeota bacterium]
MIERIDNVGVAVTDLERALAFYERVGFAIEDRETETPSALLRAGDARLWVFQSPAGPAARRSLELVGNPAGFDHVSLAVADVDSACERIAGAGLELESPPADRPDWGYRAASLLDPDGNRLFLLGALSG